MKVTSMSTCYRIQLRRYSETWWIHERWSAKTTKQRQPRVFTLRVEKKACHALSKVILFVSTSEIQFLLVTSSSQSRLFFMNVLNIFERLVATFVHETGLCGQLTICAVFRGLRRVESIKERNWQVFQVGNQIIGDKSRADHQC